MAILPDVDYFHLNMLVFGIFSFCKCVVVFAFVFKFFFLTFIEAKFRWTLIDSTDSRKYSGLHDKQCHGLDDIKVERRDEKYCSIMSQTADKMADKMTKSIMD